MLFFQCFARARTSRLRTWHRTGNRRFKDRGQTDAARSVAGEANVGKRDRSLSCQDG